MPQISTAKHWRGTLNNYTENEVQSIKSTLSTRNAKYFYIVAKEIGKEENTPHLQMYVSTVLTAGSQKGRFRPLPLLSIKRDGVECTRWFKCDNTMLANYLYCCKDGDIVCCHMPKHIEKRALEIKNNNKPDSFGEDDPYHKKINERLKHLAKWWYEDENDRDYILWNHVRHVLMDSRIERLPWCDPQTFEDWALEMFR